jgi:predicted DsbA family dithiol-disulfide isomerase
MALTYLESQIDQLRDSALAQKRRLREATEGIQNNRDLTPEAKDRQIAELRANAERALLDLANKEATYITEKLASLRRTIDGPVGTSSTDVIQFRDAQDRAERLDKQSDAERVMERAIRSKDSSLAHAVFQRAIEQGWATVIDKFTEAHPSTSDAVNDYVTLDRFQNDMTRVFERSFTYGLL